MEEAESSSVAHATETTATEAAAGDEEGTAIEEGSEDGVAQVTSRHIERLPCSYSRRTIVQKRALELCVQLMNKQNGNIPLGAATTVGATESAAGAAAAAAAGAAAAAAATTATTATTARVGGGSPYGSLLSSHILFSINEWNHKQERMFLLCENSLLRVKLNFISMEIEKVVPIPLSAIANISFGEIRMSLPWLLQMTEEKVLAESGMLGQLAMRIEYRSNSDGNSGGGGGGFWQSFSRAEELETVTVISHLLPMETEVYCECYF